MSENNNKKSNYYIIIPPEVLRTNISPMAKILFGEILVLSHKEGYCWANNRYFANLYSCNTKTISGYIKELKNKEFIFTQDEYNKRIIRVSSGLQHYGGVKKSSQTRNHTTTHNNTRNNKNITTEPPKYKDTKKVIEEANKNIPQTEEDWQRREEALKKLEKRAKPGN